MLDEDNGEGWCTGIWLITPQESLSSYHNGVYDKDNETPVDYTKACELADTSIFNMVNFDPDRLTDDNIGCILGELLLTQDELDFDEGLVMSEYTMHQPVWTEEGVVDEVNKIIRRICYGLL